MQIFVLALIAGLFIHDSITPQHPDALIHPWTLAAAVLAPKALLGIAYATLCRLTTHRLGTPAGPAALHRAEHASAVLPIAAVLLYATDLSLGLLQRVRDWMGDMVLVDELVVIAPPLLLIIFGWWAYYPIDRRLRNALLIRHLDAGTTIHPVWTRGQYLLSQLRHQIALILLPLLALWTWAETVAMYGPESAKWLNNTDPRPMLTWLGSAVVFLFTPIVIRHVWDTTPLPPGQLRDRLTAMCDHYRVGVRALLLWRTFGCMVNGAVMGLIAPVRYILLTDALLEGLTPAEIEAVMAHEIAHIKKHHVFWLMAVAASSLGILAVAWGIAFEVAAQMAADAPGSTPVSEWLADPHLRTATAIALATLCWFGVIGWVSRRFERQADSFAVQHIAEETAATEHPETPPITIDASAIHAMVSALSQVAELNRVNPHKKSWRHGSIAWRQDYLRSLRDQPIGRLSIDRHVRHIKMAAAFGLAVLAALYWQAPGWL